MVFFMTFYPISVLGNVEQRKDSVYYRKYMPDYVRIQFAGGNWISIDKVGLYFLRSSPGYFFLLWLCAKMGHCRQPT